MLSCWQSTITYENLILDIFSLGDREKPTIENVYIQKKSKFYKRFLLEFKGIDIYVTTK